MLKYMKILITGGFGYIGQNFIKKYSHSHEIIIFNRNSTIKPKFDSKIITEIGTIEKDDIDKIIKKHKPEIVIHLAALSGLKKCEDYPSEAFLLNVYGTLNVVKACIAEKCKLIFLSSREVYGETIENESSEDDPLKPVNVYGFTKSMSEKIIQFYSKTQNLDYVILRLTNVYGPGGGVRGVNRIIDNALQKNCININGDGNQTLNLIFIEDVIDLLNQIIENKIISNQIFNVGSDDTLTINQFSQIVIDMLKIKIKLQFFPRIIYENIYFKPNLRKLKKIIKFQPNFSLEQGLNKTILSF